MSKEPLSRIYRLEKIINTDEYHLSNEQLDILDDAADILDKLKTNELQYTAAKLHNDKLNLAVAEVLLYVNRLYKVINDLYQ